MKIADQLLAHLTRSGWEQTDVNDERDDWFLDEYWVMKSVRANWGVEIHISFLVDPMWEGPRRKGQGLWVIMASHQLPTTFNQAPGRSRTLRLGGRGVFARLDGFVSEIESLREDSGLETSEGDSR